jgi:glycerol kinase
MKEGDVLAIDQGKTGLKTIVFNHEGQIVGQS